MEVGEEVDEDAERPFATPQSEDVPPVWPAEEQLQKTRESFCALSDPEFRTVEQRLTEKRLKDFVDSRGFVNCVASAKLRPMTTTRSDNLQTIERLSVHYLIQRAGL